MTSVNYVIKCVFILILFWFTLLGMMTFVSGPSRLTHNDDGFRYTGVSPNNGDSAQLVKRIDVVLNEVNDLKKNYDDMKRILSGGVAPGRDDGKIDSFRNNNTARHPPPKYERIRRLLEIDLKEFWYNVWAKRANFGDKDMAQIREVYHQLRGALMQLRAEDGFEPSRQHSLDEMSNLIQKRIYDLQNPKDCKTARKLVCTLNKGCGFGCQLHHVGYCLIVAYATSRTLILESKGWRYNRQGWEKVFLPLSDTCTNTVGSSRGEWSAGKHNVQVLNLPIVDFLKPRPPYLPVAVPSDLAATLEVIHGEPHIFWIGQFMKYLLRLQPSTNATIEDSKTKLGIESPVVGIHIRRTDKIGTEASFHALKEYMDHAEDYFNILENFKGAPVKRKAFIASDDPGAITEATNTYSSLGWEIIGDKGVAQSASLSQRYYALHGIIKDVFLLSECDIVICTFSSQVCRLAYEIMQTRHPDASQRFISLDDVYYYGGGIGVIQVAVKHHEPRNDQEIDLKPGDAINLAGNHWNGLSKGTNRRTNRMGLFPSHKVRDAQQRVDFPVKKWWQTFEP